MTFFAQCSIADSRFDRMRRRESLNRAIDSVANLKEHAAHGLPRRDCTLGLGSQRGASKVNNSSPPCSYGFGAQWVSAEAQAAGRTCEP